MLHEALQVQEDTEEVVMTLCTAEQNKKTKTALGALLAMVPDRESEGSSVEAFKHVSHTWEAI